MMPVKKLVFYFLLYNEMFLLLFVLVGALLGFAWFRGWNLFSTESKEDELLQETGCLDPDKIRSSTDNCICDSSRALYPTYVNAEEKEGVSHLQCLTCPDDLLEDIEYEGEMIKVCNTESLFGGSSTQHIVPTFQHIPPELYTSSAFVATQEDMADMGLDLTMKEFEGGDLLWGCWQEEEEMIEGASHGRYYTHYPVYNPNHLDDAYKYSCKPCPAGSKGGIKNSQDAIWQTCILDDISEACPNETVGAQAFIEPLDSSGVYSELTIICQGEDRYTEGWKLTQVEMKEQEEENIDKNQAEPKDNGPGTLGFQTLHGRQVYGCWSRIEMENENGGLSMHLSHYPLKTDGKYECATCPIGTKGQIVFGDMGDILQTCVVENSNVCAGEPHYRTGVPTIVSQGDYTTIRAICDGDLLHEAAYVRTQDKLKRHSKTCVGQFGEATLCTNKVSADETNIDVVQESDISWNPDYGYRGAGVYGCWGDSSPGLGYIPHIVGDGAECVRCPSGYQSLVDQEGEDVWQRCVLVPGEEVAACNSVQSGGNPTVMSVNDFIPYSTLYVSCSGDEENEPNADRSLEYQGYFLDDLELYKLQKLVDKSQVCGLPLEQVRFDMLWHWLGGFNILSAIKVPGITQIGDQYVNTYEVIMRRPCLGANQERKIEEGGTQGIEGRRQMAACENQDVYCTDEPCNFEQNAASGYVDEVSRIYATIGTDGITWRLSEDSVIVSGDVYEPSQFSHLFTDIKEGESSIEHPYVDEIVPASEGIGYYGWYCMRADRSEFTQSDRACSTPHTTEEFFDHDESASRLGKLLTEHYQSLVGEDLNINIHSAIKRKGEPIYEINYIRKCHSEDFSPNGMFYNSHVGPGR